MSFAKRTNNSIALEFDPNEINARSTDFQNNEMQTTFNKAASFINTSIHNIKDNGRPSVEQMFATSICGKLNFEDDEFQSADLMSSKLRRDEMSYYEKFAHIPSTSHQNESLFEGTINQNSIGNFFLNDNSLLQNLKSAPSSVNSPIALVDLTNSGKYIYYINLSRKISFTLNANSILKINQKAHVSFPLHRSNEHIYNFKSVLLVLFYLYISFQIPNGEKKDLVYLD